MTDKDPGLIQRPENIWTGYPHYFKRKHNDEQPDKINGKRGAFIHYAIIQRLNKGYAPLVLIYGREGTGKTMTGLRIAHDLHNKFNVCTGPWTPENMALDVTTFAKRVFGSVRQNLLVDEAGVNLNSREHYTVFNMSMDKIVQTQRFREHVYSLIGPEKREIDKRFIRKADVKVRCIKPGVVKVTVEKEDYTARSDTDTTEVTKVWQPSLPPQDLIKQYREREREEKDRIMQEIIQKLEKEDQKQKDQTLADL